MNEDKYIAIMRFKANEELVKIVFMQREDYAKEAVVSAETELKNRNLLKANINSILDDWKNRKMIEEQKACQPLCSGVKIWVCIFPFLLNFIFSFIYKADGYDRKTKEVWKWTLYGLCLYFGLFLLLTIALRFIE